MPENSCTPESLLIVRSTLEMALLLRRHYPGLEARILEVEVEVKEAGQSLIVAGSVARARLALERIHQARLALEQLGNSQMRIAA